MPPPALMKDGGEKQQHVEGPAPQENEVEMNANEVKEDEPMDVEPFHQAQSPPENAPVQEVLAGVELANNQPSGPERAAVVHMVAEEEHSGAEVPRQPAAAESSSDSGPRELPQQNAAELPDMEDEESSEGSPPPLHAWKESYDRELYLEYREGEVKQCKREDRWREKFLHYLRFLQVTVPALEFFTPQEMKEVVEAAPRDDWDNICKESEERLIDDPADAVDRPYELREIFEEYYRYHNQNPNAVDSLTEKEIVFLIAPVPRSLIHELKRRLDARRRASAPIVAEPSNPPSNRPTLPSQSSSDEPGLSQPSTSREGDVPNRKRKADESLSRPTSSDSSTASNRPAVHPSESDNDADDESVN